VAAAAAGSALEMRRGGTHSSFFASHLPALRISGRLKRKDEKKGCFFDCDVFCRSFVVVFGGGGDDAARRRGGVGSGGGARRGDAMVVSSTVLLLLFVAG
jgi:hypothetical protein